MYIFSSYFRCVTNSSHIPLSIKMQFCGTKAKRKNAPLSADTVIFIQSQFRGLHSMRETEEAKAQVVEIVGLIGPWSS